MGGDAAHPVDGVQGGVHGGAAAGEGLAHHDDVVEGSGDGGDGGALSHVGHVRGGVALEVGGGLYDVVGADEPADAPAGHGVGLGDAVDDEALLGDLGHEGGHGGELVVAVDEVLVDLVGDDPHAVLDGPAPDGGDLVGGVDRSGGVVGADEEQHFGARGAGGFELVDGDFEPGGVVGVDDDGHSPGERDGFGVGRPIRGGADDLVARIAQRREGGVDGVLAAVGDEHLGGVDGDAGVAEGLGGDRLAQLGQAAGGCVAVVAHFGAGGDGRLDDVVGGGEVGFAGAEADDVLPFGLEGLGLGVHGEGGRGGDGGEAGCGAVHPATLPRIGRVPSGDLCSVRGRCRRWRMSRCRYRQCRSRRWGCAAPRPSCGGGSHLDRSSR